ETIRLQALFGGLLVLVAMFAIVKPRESETINGN
ncbi:MAG: hypothetical protein RL399_1100, partial [Actinomycetota bacterium]